MFTDERMAMKSDSFNPVDFVIYIFYFLFSVCLMLLSIEIKSTYHFFFLKSETSIIYTCYDPPSKHVIQKDFKFSQHQS